jgi:hypothetical protein
MARSGKVVSLTSLSGLCSFVHEELCRRERLDPAQAPLRTSTIRRSGRPCGLFLHVEGPRLMRSYAIWAGEENRVLFYDSAGVRSGEFTLSESPDPGCLAR